MPPIRRAAPPSSKRRRCASTSCPSRSPWQETDDFMDVKTRAAPPTEAERSAVQSVLGAEGSRQLHVLSGGHINKARRHLLLPTLHAVNDRVGWISSSGIHHTAERLDLPPAEVYGVASFYALFALAPRDPHQVLVCPDLACRANGGQNVGD